MLRVVLTLHLSGNIQYNLHEGQRVDSDEEAKNNKLTSKQAEKNEPTQGLTFSSPVFEVTEEIVVKL